MRYIKANINSYFTTSGDIFQFSIISFLGIPDTKLVTNLPPIPKAKENSFN